MSRPISSTFRFDKVMGLGKSQQIEQVSITESFLRKQILVVNRTIISVREKFKLRNQEGVMQVVEK